MRKESFTCDVCGAVKGTTNHWWRVYVDGVALSVIGWDARAEWDKEFHICGEACALKKVSEFMGRK